MNAEFEASLEVGRIGERIVTAWLQERGWGVIPSWNYTGSDGNMAPRLFFADRGLVVPDLDVCRVGKRCWVEVKHYHYAPYNRTHGCHVHGIERRLRDSYLEVQRETGNVVWLAIVEQASGDILLARLDALTVYPCLCNGCRSGKGRCAAAINRGAYFNRAEFRAIGKVTDDEA